MDETSNVYRDLESLDPLRDLENRSVYASGEDFSLRWIGTPAIPDALDLTKETYLHLYYYMKKMRELDGTLARLTKQARAFGKHLVSAGNEASAVGSVFALQKKDWMVSAIRDLGAFLVRGTPTEKIIAQSCGRSLSSTGGWDAGLHVIDPENRIIGIISHLGTMPCVANGLAFSEKYKNTDSVVLSFIGDGATSKGDFHEACNIAAVLELPIVFVVENNQWAFGTPSKLQFATPALMIRALGYGSHVDGYLVDGTNVLTVYDITNRALERARQKKGITIIETMTLRLHGHSLADPYTTYMPKEELDAWSSEAKDPIAKYKKLLIDKNIAEETDFTALDEKIKEELKEAEKRALESPPPNATNIESKVFTPSPLHENVLIVPPKNGRYIPYHEAIREALREEMDRDLNLFLAGEDIGIKGGAFEITKGFLERYDGISWNNDWRRKKERFPERRVIDSPVAETGLCGLAMGAAHGGLSSVVEFQYADFASEGFKMLVHYATTQTVRGLGPLPIVFRMPAGWARNASMFHSVNPESWFAGAPGLKIVAPITAFDAKGLLKAAIRDKNPILYLEYKEYYRYTKNLLPPELYTPVPEEEYVVPIGKARIVKNGNALTIISYGSQIYRALLATHAVEKELGDTTLIEVIDLRSIIPWDTDCVLESVKKTSKALITCEAPKTGSFGNTVAAHIASAGFSFLDAPVRLVAAKDTPVPFAKELEEAHLPTVEKLVSAIKDLLAY